jgi:photosystem II stability/assembly factor-like uncharacterized protein
MKTIRMSWGRPLALTAAPLLLAAFGVTAAFAQPASGNPTPPKGFEADATSFVSPSTGYVLGAKGCSRLPCKAGLEKTTNGGKTWKSVQLPSIDLQEPYTGIPKSAVNDVRFENASDGWLFGPALWATTDGGKHWQKQTLPGQVIALEAADDTGFAISEPIDGGTNQAKLYEKTGSGKWTVVKGIAPQNAITVYGHSVWTGIAPELWTSANSGKTWTKLTFTCPHSAISASQVAAATTRNVVIACSNQGYPQPGFSIKYVYTSSNGGKTFHQVGQPPEPGQVGELALPPGNPKVITMTSASGASYLYRSVDGGKTWHTATFYDGGLDFRDLAYVSATTGYLIHYNGGPVLAYSLGLLKTSNTGFLWKPVAIP